MTHMFLQLYSLMITATAVCYGVKWFMAMKEVNQLRKEKHDLTMKLWNK